jgi:NADH-quinone oxidoreductase subunit J
MPITFTIIAIVTIACAVAALSLRNLVHCALALAGAFVGLAGVYLQLGAQFVGLAQVLVYVGAVSILVVFAILLTRNDHHADLLFSKAALASIGVTVAVLGVLVWAIVKSPTIKKSLPPAPAPSVKAIGDALMTKCVLPLEVMGLLLTAALIGAVIIAMQNHSSKSPGDKGGHQ